MAAGAATVTNLKFGTIGQYRVATFQTDLGSTATNGVEIYLGWSNVDHVSITMLDATPEAIGQSYAYSSGTLTIYGVAAGNSETITVAVFGQD